MSDSQISEREREILRLVATGATNQQIAQQLHISANTVKVHLRNIFSKIGAASRTEATLYAVRTGLVKVDNTSLGAASPSSTPAENSTAAIALAPPEVLPEAEALLVLERDNPIGSLDRQVDTAIPVDDSPQTTIVIEQAKTPARSLDRRWLFGGALAALLLIAGLVFVLTQMTVAPTQPATNVPASVDVALPIPNERWRALPSMPGGRSGFALASFSDGNTSYLYVIGGDQGGTVSAEVVRYDLNARVWAPWGNKPTAVGDIQAAVIGNKIYVPGGRLASGAPTDVFEVYDPQTNLWTALKPLPQPRSGYALATAEGKLYLFGGWDGATYRNEVWQYNPDLDQWNERSPMPTARAFAGAATLESQIYIIGGENKDGALTVNERYTPSDDGSGNPWATQQPLLAPRSHMAVTTSNNRIFVVGGAETKEQLLVFNTAWLTQTIPLGAIRDLRAQAIRDKLYIVGGQSSAGTNSEAYEYQAFYTVMLPVGPPAPP